MRQNPMPFAIKSPEGSSIFISIGAISIGANFFQICVWNKKSWISQLGQKHLTSLMRYGFISTYQGRTHFFTRLGPSRIYAELYAIEIRVSRTGDNCRYQPKICMNFQYLIIVTVRAISVESLAENTLLFYVLFKYEILN